MNRVLPDDVVQAYYQTGLIPIRCAWTSDDGRGSCAMDALATHRGITTQELRESLPGRYEEGFLLAWDSEDPRHDDVVEQVKAEHDDAVKRGFCDGILCRSAVEKTFSTAAFVEIANDS